MPTRPDLSRREALLALGAAGIYVGETDDAPGAALIGLLLMIGAVASAVKIASRRP